MALAGVNRLDRDVGCRVKYRREGQKGAVTIQDEECTE